MTRNPFVIANWKMNANTQANQAWMDEARVQLTGSALACDVAVCAPFVYLPQLCEGFSHSAALVGAQNCASYSHGAYTGEVSAAMLADIGCDMVIVGHSERRTLFGETDAIVAEKVRLAYENGVMPILCVGETLQEREEGRTIEVVAAQLKAVLDTVGVAPFFAEHWLMNPFGQSVPVKVQRLKTLRAYMQPCAKCLLNTMKKVLKQCAFFTAVASILPMPQSFLHNKISTVH